MAEDAQGWTLREVAHHEAAHAVALFWLDIPFRKVTIRPHKKQRISGCVARHRRPRWLGTPVGTAQERRNRLRIEAEVVALYAGAWGQAKLTGEMPEEGHDGDDSEAAVMASNLISETEEFEAFLRFCFLQARNLVLFHWVEIQAVASALLERQTLTREQVRQVIADI